MIFIGSVQAEDFGPCGYIPKKTEQYQYPEWEVFDLVRPEKSRHFLW